MKIDKLLIVDNYENKNTFTDNYLLTNYMGWKIIYIGNPSCNSCIEFSTLSIEQLLDQYKDTFRYFLILKSSDFFIKNFSLDLVSEVLEFPTVDEFGSVTVKTDIKKSITLKDDLYYKLIKTSVLQNENWKLKKFSYQYVNYLFIQKQSFDYQIDYVFPYVNCEDPTWLADYLKYKNTEGLKVEQINKQDSRYENNYSTGIQRFRDSGLMKYVFRSIEKNLPFIRKVHMIVASDSQVPNWVNKYNIDIITHDEFIPRRFLPTFSSSEIEMFLPKLPRVSNYFIYGNDDEYFLKPQKISNWFFEGKPVSFANIRPMNDMYTGDIFRRNDLLLTAPASMQIPKDSCLGQQHCPQPYVLSSMQDCYKTYESEILASCTRFRENTKNFNQWIFLGYNYFNNFLYLKKRMCLTTDLSQFNDSINLQKYTCACINDSDEKLQLEGLNLFIEKMENIFPKKSKYEV